MTNIQLTPAALDQIKKQIALRGTPDVYLRLGIKGGDCAGFSYVLSYEDKEPKERDISFQIDGIKVIIDKKSILYLEGVTLDWKSSLMEQGFFFINPHEKSRCSCGKSFSV